MMDTIRQQLEKPLITAAIGFVLGLIIGLFALGWGLFPVQWTDATPQFLRDDLKSDYLRMVIDSYGKNQDAALAQQRFASLGEDGEEVFTVIQSEPGTLTPADIAGFGAVVQAGPVLPAQTEVPAQAGTAAAATTTEPVKKSSLPLILGVLCAATLLALGGLAYVVLVRNRRQPIEPMVEVNDPALSHRVEEAGYPVARDEAPVAQFMTTFMTGDDLYDDSFSIDSPSGEFLGECGVGISDSIGVGDPKKVTAFEVWLFDKNDIQTITKVLMSHHAFTDPAISQRLESKGEPVLAEPGKRVLLETATLQLEARVVDMSYGQGALPANSYFERLTLELAVWPKPTQA